MATEPNETSKRRSFYGAMFALLENVERDVDDHVLLPAHHAAAAEFGENVAGVHAIELRGVLGVAQEARIDAGEAEREALAVDPHRPVLQGPHETVRGVHQAMQITARLDAHSLEHGDQRLDRRIARARAHA